MKQLVDGTDQIFRAIEALRVALKHIGGAGGERTVDVDRQPRNL